MKFSKLFTNFWQHRDHAKVIFVGSCGSNRKPNVAPKMLVDIVKPNKVFYIDYAFTQSYTNLLQNKHMSLAIMDDRAFRGLRFNGQAKILKKGREFKAVQKKWDQKICHYEAMRMVDRIRGQRSARRAENSLPEDFVIVKFTVREASEVHPDRIIRARYSTHR